MRRFAFYAAARRGGAGVATILAMFAAAGALAWLLMQIGVPRWLAEPAGIIAVPLMIVGAIVAVGTGKPRRSGP